ncbi:flagellar export protein FliJ [Paenibacillus profundus]|uniref:Flagellar FliJ protein n=1 Tax=Paenibacillus profundus TaxID=1173085 RepID=A0ABS8Y8H2_9BACL|nr:MULTISPECIES: flagellar export protein FliJ [Paenibacillus]MCE5168056.1 flagellar export protein FliJ [Paenibacillus profundus]MCM3337304.1 flagellar export protein FliJ [Paenibacillus sp. MER TA 81-3]
MRAFQYSFQKVLDLKTNEKKQAEWILSEAMGRLQAEEKQLQHCLLEMESVRKKMQQSIDACAPAADIQAWQQYISHLEGQVHLARKRVYSAEIQVRDKQSKLAERMTDEKVWTKAREKAETNFKRQMALWEQNELDELATVRYHMAAR